MEYYLYWAMMITHTAHLSTISTMKKAVKSISMLAHSAATETMLSLLDRFLEQIPVLRLECTPDAAAVDVLYQALERLPL